jgi:hypothetical protein
MILWETYCTISRSDDPLHTPKSPEGGGYNNLARVGMSAAKWRPLRKQQQRNDGLRPSLCSAAHSGLALRFRLSTFDFQTFDFQTFDFQTFDFQTFDFQTFDFQTFRLSTLRLTFRLNLPPLPKFPLQWPLRLLMTCFFLPKYSNQHLYQV